MQGCMLNFPGCAHRRQEMSALVAAYDPTLCASPEELELAPSFQRRINSMTELHVTDPFVLEICKEVLQPSCA